MLRSRLATALMIGAALVGSSAAGAPAAHAAPIRSAQVTTSQSSAGHLTARPLASRTTIRYSQLDRRCRTGRVVCVSKTHRKVVWVVNGQIRMVLDARFGAARTPTRNGSFRIYYKDRDHVSHQYHSRMPFSMFFSGGQAVHYSSDFAQRGYAGASHGCVNTREWSKIKALYGAARVGDRVVVYWG